MEGCTFEVLNGLAASVKQSSNRQETAVLYGNPFNTKLVLCAQMRTDFKITEGQNGEKVRGAKRPSFFAHYSKSIAQIVYLPIDSNKSTKSIKKT